MKGFADQSSHGSLGRSSFYLVEASSLRGDHYFRQYILCLIS